MRARVIRLMLMAVCAAPPAHAQVAPALQTAPASAAAGDTTFVVRNLTRAELWRFFEPRVGGGVHPDYVFAGNRSTLGARYDGSRWALRGAIQYVRLENLPTGAIGPGLLGTGGAYFFQANGTFSYQFYLRGLSLTFKRAAGASWLEAGRFSRAAADEPASGDATIDTLTRGSLNGRLLGDMEWSLYQRAWDGLRGGVVRDGWRATLTAAVPTQGTYEESANLAMYHVRVVAAEVTTRPGRLVRHTALTTFAYGYDDDRQVTTRPDNQGSSANSAVAAPTRADVRIGTVGGSLAGAYPQGSRRWDVLLWTAGQAGDWYGQSHRAYALAAQGGHQWAGAPWRPWLRAGVDYASGDRDPGDDRHGTFFAMLPSGNQFSRSSTYALSNIVDAWGEVRVSPAPSVDAQLALHHVDLAHGADGWYTGSGATMRSGNYFGFQTRPSNGATQLGAIVEGEVTWRPIRWWTLRAYGAHMAGGDVVRNLFGGARLTTAWLESLFSF
ncbi:MAG: alginate export family protein [Acidobacteriota bacterium]